MHINGDRAIKVMKMTGRMVEHDVILRVAN